MWAFINWLTTLISLEYFNQTKSWFVLDFLPKKLFSTQIMMLLHVAKDHKQIGLQQIGWNFWVIHRTFTPTFFASLLRACLVPWIWITIRTIIFIIMNNICCNKIIKLIHSFGCNIRIKLKSCIYEIYIYIYIMVVSIESLYFLKYINFISYYTY